MAKETSELTIPEGENYAIRPATPEEVDRINTDSDIPEYKVQITVDEDQEERLRQQVFLAFDAMVEERRTMKLEEKWKERDAQYDGDINDNPRLLFNLHVFQSMIKVDAIVRALKKSFLNSGQIADITPRPDMAQTKDGWTVCDIQSEYIDFTFDEEIKPEKDLEKIAKCAAKKFVGMGRVLWAYRTEKRRREETYEGKNEVVASQNGQPVLKNEGLEDFLKTYPDAAQNQKAYVRRLLEEKKINIVVEYKDTVNNNVKLKYVKIEDFYVRNACDYWEGLRTEHCVIERETFSYHELLKMEKDGELSNVAELWGDAPDTASTENKDKSDKNQDYKTRSYDVLRCTTYFKMDEADEDEIKIISWFGESKKTFHGAILFPYYALDTDYIPFYLKLNDYGFYGDARSIMHTLRDSNIAQDALLSLFMHGTYSRHIMTPIVKEGSTIQDLFLEKIFVEGMPLPVDEMTQDVSKEIGFVQWPAMDSNGFMSAIQFQQRMDSNSTGITDAAATGANDPSDPNAPAHKTIALLQQSGINIEDYVETFLPSFNIFVTYVLQLNYQMSQEGRKFRIRRKALDVVGTDPFKSITRDQLIAKTNVQARAASFVFDKNNERATAMAGLGMVQSNSFAAQIPKVQYSALRLAISSLGPQWKNLADSDLPSPDQFKQMMMDVAKQAIVELDQQAKQQEAVTGVRPQITPEQVADHVAQAQAGAYNPALAEAHAKAQDQQGKGK